MSAKLLTFRHRRRGWSNEERAQFERLENQLRGAGLDIEYECGETDEGEPWCVFSAANSPDVVIHIARIDGHYVFDSPALHEALRGRSLDDCVGKFVADAAIMRRPNQDRQIYMHPSAMLAGIALTLFLYVEAASDRLGLERILRDEAEAGKADTNAETQKTIAYLKQLAAQIADFIASRSDEERCRTQGERCGIIVSANATALAATYEISRLFDHADPVDEPAAAERQGDDAEVVDSLQARERPERDTTPTAALDSGSEETAGNPRQEDVDVAEVPITGPVSDPGQVQAVETVATVDSFSHVTDSIVSVSNEFAVGEDVFVEVPADAELESVETSVVSTLGHQSALQFARLLLELFDEAARDGNMTLTEEALAEIVSVTEQSDIANGTLEVASLQSDAASQHVDSFVFEPVGAAETAAPVAAQLVADAVAPVEIGDVVPDSRTSEPDFQPIPQVALPPVYSVDEVRSEIRHFKDRSDAWVANYADGIQTVVGVTIHDEPTDAVLSKESYLLEDGSRVVLLDFEGDIKDVAPFIDDYLATFGS